MKQKFDIITSTCVPLRLENIDTDQIIPARFLKATTKEEAYFGDKLFYDWRYNADGSLNTDFVLNNPLYSGEILVVGPNFGSGSSREHAAWAIAGYGFRVVISSFFADIHKNNELNNFVLPVVISEDFLNELFTSIEQNPQTQVEVNLPEQKVTNLATNRSESFEINGYKKYCLMNALDDIDFLLQSKDKIQNWETKQNQQSCCQMKENAKIEIMDTTLRDGEQTSGVSFLPHEKLIIARALLQDLKVDRIEVASARVSDGEKEAVKNICNWARQEGYLDQVEVLGFVDGKASLEWIQESGCKNINLLCKGSLTHCTDQLHKTPQEHIADIKQTLQYAQEMGIGVNLYLEDWSNGMKHSIEYVFQLLDALKNSPIKRFMLPDTLGVLNPLQVHAYIRKMVRRYPSLHFDFHAHNDYDLAISNVIAAVLGGCHGIHTSVNGLGERAGNACLASVQVILKDHLNINTQLDETRLNEVSRLVEYYSGMAIPSNQPITGENVFTQVAGVHADGDNKGNLYCNDLLPERFKRKREYALGKNSGKASILKNLKELGLQLTPEQTKRVTERIIELGDKKELVTQDDLPFIVTDVLKHTTPEDNVKLLSYMVSTAYGLKPMANVKLEINGNAYEENASGDGQFDAFMRATRHIYKQQLGREFPWLSNYYVSIPPGGRTDALVQTTITWNWNNKEYRTRALDADQTEAAIKATIKMLNLIEPDFKNN